MVALCKVLFKHCILPELVAKYFTIDRDDQITTVDPNIEKYCICDGVETGELYACYNKDCEYKLFHLKCVNMINKPKKNWLCPYCTVH